MSDDALVIAALLGGPLCWHDIAAACRPMSPSAAHRALRRLRRRGVVVVVVVESRRLPRRGSSRIAGSGQLYGLAPCAVEAP